jgi:nucleotide-binding universal stress UspA family protein
MNTDMKILIGYDGSEYGEIFINDLKKAGLPVDTEAILLAVADVREIPASPFLAQRISSRIEKFVTSVDEENDVELNKYLENIHTPSSKLIKKLKENFPDWKLSYEVYVGKPATELIKKADDWKPDILFVGSHGRSALGRLVLGSVSQKVLTESHCPVRISKKGSNGEDLNLRILIALDGSSSSEAVVQKVAKRVWPPETEIRLISVDDPFHRPEFGYMNWNHKESKPIDNKRSREWITQIINEPKQKLESAGLKVSYTLVWGDAGSMILKEAEDWRADVIFMGARGLGPLKRFLLGSVSSWVAPRAVCSVEVIHI